MVEDIIDPADTNGPHPLDPHRLPHVRGGGGQGLWAGSVSGLSRPGGLVVDVKQGGQMLAAMSELGQPAAIASPTHWIQRNDRSGLP